MKFTRHIRSQASSGASGPMTSDRSSGSTPQRMPAFERFGAALRAGVGNDGSEGVDGFLLRGQDQADGLFGVTAPVERGDGGGGGSAERGDLLDDEARIGQL